MNASQQLNQNISQTIDQNQLTMIQGLQNETGSLFTQINQISQQFTDIQVNLQGSIVKFNNQTTQISQYLNQLSQMQQLEQNLTSFTTNYTNFIQESSNLYQLLNQTIYGKQKYNFYYDSFTWQPEIVPSQIINITTNKPMEFTFNQTTKVKLTVTGNIWQVNTAGWLTFMADGSYIAEYLTFDNNVWFLGGFYNNDYWACTPINFSQEVIVNAGTHVFQFGLYYQDLKDGPQTQLTNLIFTVETQPKLY
ncbi:hypothetical protein ABPG73_003547 [Tetrahymena malaccensis]